MDIKSFAEEAIAHYKALLAEGKSDKEAAELTAVHMDAIARKERVT